MGLSTFFDRLCVSFRLFMLGAKKNSAVMIDFTRGSACTWLLSVYTSTIPTMYPVSRNRLPLPILVQTVIRVVSTFSERYQYSSVRKGQVYFALGGRFFIGRWSAIQKKWSVCVFATHHRHRHTTPQKRPRMHPDANTGAHGHQKTQTWTNSKTAK